MRVLPLILVAFALLGTTAEAKTTAENDEIVANYFRSGVQILRHPVTVYHWFKGDNAAQFWRSGFSASDPAGFDYVRQGAQVYWREKGSPAEKNGGVYGYGLYTATDPMSSIFWGGQKDWVLVQITIPSGTRLLDTLTFWRQTPTEVQQSLVELGCDLPSQTLNHGLQPTTNRPCAEVLRRILEGHLGVQGLATFYQNERIGDCPGQIVGSIILTQLGGISPSDVRIFNSKTRDDVEDRRRIESMALLDDVPKADYLKRTMTARACEDLRDQRTATWPDLEGKPVDPDLPDWVHTHQYGCGSAPIFKLEDLDKSARGCGGAPADSLAQPKVDALVQSATQAAGAVK